MNKRILILSWIFSTFFSALFAQQDANIPLDIIQSLEKLEAVPQLLSFHNSLDIEQDGGHLQGIQAMSFRDAVYYVLSGSSSEYSYYSVVKSGKENMVISVNRIMELPFKHAGGFQIFENLMAIGVEDNEAKNKSKVFIFHLENPEKLPREPLAVIDRMGTFKRATAGCVAITEIVEKVLVVVGDWDTEHLDFYRIDRERLFEENPVLELEYSMNLKKADKSGWIDSNWLSYQNLNFIKNTDEKLYLAGMTSNEKGENVIDLFLVLSEDLSNFKLQKIYSRTFPENATTKFRWGSGIFIDEKQQISILSSPGKIDANSQVNIYK